MTTNLKAGDRVRLLREVERYPEFIAAAGSTGTVVASRDDFLSVKMDCSLNCSEEYDNCIIWCHPEPGEIEGDVQLIATPATITISEGLAWFGDGTSVEGVTVEGVTALPQMKQQLEYALAIIENSDHADDHSLWLDETRALLKVKD